VISSSRLRGDRGPVGPDRRDPISWSIRTDVVHIDVTAWPQRPKVLFASQGCPSILRVFLIKALAGSSRTLALSAYSTHATPPFAGYD